MSDHTYIKFYESEIRTVQLLIRDQEEEDFVPDTATCNIEDELGTVIVSETICYVYNNTISFTVPQTITDTKGLYNVIWTITKNNKIYKHKTILNVAELT
jgi:hypothetical protein